MFKKLKLALIAALLAAPLLAMAGAEEDALKALDDANARVLALSAIKSPSVQNYQSAQGELSALGPFFQKVSTALSQLNVGPSTQLLELGASVQAKISTAGSISTVNIGVFIDTCRGLSGDLDQWQALLPDVRRALQQRVDAKTQDLIREQVNQTFPTPIPGLGSGGGANVPTPIPAFTPVYPTAVPTLPPISPAAPTPTPVAPVDGGVIPGGWTPPPPTAIPTYAPGVPTAQPTPQTQSKAPVPIAVGHNGQRVWVGNVRANTVSVMDARSQRFVAEIPVGSQPQAIGLDDGDNNVVVANFGSNSVTLIDGRADSVLKTLTVPAGPMQVLVIHSGKAYVLCQDGKSLAVIDLKLKLLLKSIKLSSRPGRMDQPNSSQNIYVTLPDEDSVAVIDTGYDDVMATVKD